MTPVARRIGRAAVRALHAELVLHPKPGLVSPGDSGSHADMDAARMWRGIVALRGTFTELAAAGARGETFRQLQARGQRAEARLLAATGGVNTHRGALFHLGLLAAAAGAGARGTALGEHVRTHAGPDLERDGADAGGARQEAAAGYPTVFGVALPALAEARAQGLDETAARVLTLFVLISTVGDDTCLLRRGGPDGQRFAQEAARRWLTAGGASTPDWRERTLAVHREFCQRRLSPGGSADLLAAALFVEALTDLRQKSPGCPVAAVYDRRGPEWNDGHRPSLQLEVQ